MSRAVPRFRRSNPTLPALIPNLFEVVVSGLIENQLTINTFYYYDGGAALVPTSEQNLATGWQTSFLTAYRACLSADWTATSIKVSCITSPNRMPYVLLLGNPNGTGPAGHAPTTVAVVISRVTGVKGQCGRGRVMMPAVPLTWLGNSNITSIAGQAAYNAFAVDCMTGFLSGGVTFVASLYSKGTRTNKTPGAAVITGATFRNLVGTVRRRRIGKGK